MKSSTFPRLFLSLVGQFWTLCLANFMGHFFTLEELLLVWPESAVWHQEEVVLLFKSHFNHVAFLAASKREMTASNNISFGQLEEGTNLTHCHFKFAPFGNLCIICLGFFKYYRTTDNTMLYHYEIKGSCEQTHWCSR